jgi:hypothetical protein
MTPLTFIFLSTTDWDAPQFGSRQQIARELASRGHRVLFVEVARALHSFISDPPGARRAMRRFNTIRSVAPNLVAYTPAPVVPIYYSPLVSAINMRLLARYIGRVLRRLAWRADVLWTYWANSAALLGRLKERAAVYHCIDDFTAVDYPLVSRATIARLENKLCRRVDMVLTRTEALRERYAGCNEHALCLPAG